MSKIVELPLLPPVYSTYHYGTFSAAIAENPSVRNWYINRVINLTCSRKFLSGFTTPELSILGTYVNDNPYLETKWINTRFLKGYIHPIIRNLIDSGYCVYFTDIDDYYIKYKTWYKQRHFAHDGAICGYNQEDKTYCIYAYDSNWIYRKFWTPQKCFEAGRKAMYKQGVYGNICGIKPKMEKIEFSAETAIESIGRYLYTNMENCPEDGENRIYGTVVQEYIAKYVDKLIDGSVPYEKMDYRIFHLIWDHKKVMLERIERIEKALSIDTKTSEKYSELVAEANKMRMLYASHYMKRRDSVLPIIKKKLLFVADEERRILNEFLEKTRGEEK